MKLQKYIFPIFIGSNLLGQTNSGLYPKMSFGTTHSTNTSMCFNSLQIKPNFNNEQHIPQNKTKITETQFGFGLGLFMWMPLNEGIVFKRHEF